MNSRSTIKLKFKSPLLPCIFFLIKIVVYFTDDDDLLYVYTLIKPCSWYFTTSKQYTHFSKPNDYFNTKNNMKEKRLNSYYMTDCIRKSTKIPSALKNLAQTKEARKKRKMKIKKNLFHTHACIYV